MGSAAEQRVKLTNADKVLYPETGTTKEEVFHYYTRIAEVMLPHIAGRPATRKRWPNGVEAGLVLRKATGVVGARLAAPRQRHAPVRNDDLSDHRQRRRAGVDRATGGAGGTRAAVAVRRRVDPRRARTRKPGPGNTIGVRPGSRVRA